MADRKEPLRMTAALLAAGAVFLVAGTLLHPMGADPADAEAAFSEYAADRTWLWSHLIQMAGMAAISLGLVAFERPLRATPGRHYARGAAVMAVVGLSVAAVLQAVDGIALKLTVDRWAAADVAARPIAFEAAVAVRAVEIGLAAMLSLAMGVTAILYGAALVTGTRAAWLGWLAMAGGAGLALAGSLLGFQGFSPTAMTANMAASVLLLVWLAAAAAWLWRGASTFRPA